MRRLEEKCAIVTGAGAGIGRAIALRMAHEGAGRRRRRGRGGRERGRLRARRCREAVGAGWTHFKMKVGSNIEDDVRRAALIREEIGPNRKLMMDANSGRRDTLCHSGAADDVAEQLRRATESLVLQFLRYPREVTVSNNEIRSLGERDRVKIMAKRDEYGQGFQDLIERGCSLGRFHVESPRLASYAILEMGNGAKVWFRKGGLYSEAEVAHQYSEFALRIVGVAESGSALEAHRPGDGEIEQGT